jgi:hypothetical protein
MLLRPTATTHLVIFFELVLLFSQHKKIYLETVVFCQLIKVHPHEKLYALYYYRPVNVF